MAENMKRRVELSTSFEYDEELGAYIIPEGWLERKYYVMEEELNHFMDDVVTHWMPLPEPPKEVE